MDYSGKIITKNPVEPSQTSAPGVWTLDQATQAVQGNNWPIAYVPNPISRSLRFNSADSAYLNRTPASAGNRKTWTWSGWVKRSALSAGGYQNILQCNSATTDDNNYFSFRFMTDDTIGVVLYSYFPVISSAVLRDVSAWYHCVLAVDTTQATAANRMKMYINGVETPLSTDNRSSITQNSDLAINLASAHRIGSYQGSSEFFSGYMTEINFIDGQALDASSFGLTDPRTGAWIPKKYSGTYGTNGFYLNFSDNSTTAALGTDYSGNSNTWTTNNFSVTAGSGNDSMVDVPTPWVAYNSGDVGGVVRGNYATLNPLSKSSASGTTPTNGNLDIGATSTACDYMTTMFVSSGKWYFEVLVNQVDTSTPSSNPSIGVQGQGFPSSGPQAVVDKTSTLTIDGSGSSLSGFSFTTGDTIGIAFDMDSKKIWVRKNGTYYNSGDPAAGTNATGIWSAAGEVAPYIRTRGNASCSFNAGQRPFAYTPPAGFKSLCTTNLPEPAILDGGDYFNTVLYTGTGSSGNSVSGVGFQSDFVWLKNRGVVNNHILMDAVRGDYDEVLFSNLTSAESNIPVLSSVNSDGFVINTTGTSTNGSGESYVAWNWKESATSGFDIVTYTGTGSAQNINHNLGVTPAMMIVKNRTTSNDWVVWHQSYASTTEGYTYLNSTGGVATTSIFWNSTAPTSSVFTVGTSGAVNESAAAMVAYLFAAVPGFSAFGSFTGAGATTDNSFIYLGFRPRYLMFKRSDNVGDWVMLDSARSPYNQGAAYLYANASNAEATNAYQFDFLSNGVKIRDGAGNIASGATYIYAAFAENPFKYSNAR